MYQLIIILQQPDVTEVTLRPSGLRQGTWTGTGGTTTLPSSFFGCSPWLHGQQILGPCPHHASSNSASLSSLCLAMTSLHPTWPSLCTPDLATIIFSQQNTRRMLFLRSTSILMTTACLFQSFLDYTLYVDGVTCPCNNNSGRNSPLRTRDC